MSKISMTDKIVTRCPPAFRKLVQMAAKAKHMHESEYIRDAIRERMERDIHQPTREKK